MTTKTPCTCGCGTLMPQPQHAPLAPKDDPTACPVCGSPAYWVTGHRSQGGVVIRFRCGSSTEIRNGLIWEARLEDANPACLYIRELRERLVGVLGVEA